MLLLLGNRKHKLNNNFEKSVFSKYIFPLNVVVLDMGKPKNFLGIDLAGGGIKVVEFSSDNGRARLRTYGFTTSGEEGSALANLESAKKSLAEIFSAARVAGGVVHAALPTQSVFSSVLTLSKMKSEDREKAIEQQVQ